jgi:hypothetical protein
MAIEYCRRSSTVTSWTCGRDGQRNRVRRSVTAQRSSRRLRNAPPDRGGPGRTLHDLLKFRSRQRFFITAGTQRPPSLAGRPDCDATNIPAFKDIFPRWSAVTPPFARPPGSPTRKRFVRDADVTESPRRQRRRLRRIQGPIKATPGPEHFLPPTLDRHQTLGAQPPSADRPSIRLDRATGRIPGDAKRCDASALSD